MNNKVPKETKVDEHKTSEKSKSIFASKNMLCKLEWTHRIMIRELKNERKSKSFVVSSRGLSAEQIFNEIMEFEKTTLRNILRDDIIIDNVSKGMTHTIIVSPRYLTTSNKSYSFSVCYPHQFLESVAEELSKFLCRGKVAFARSKKE